MAINWMMPLHLFQCPYYLQDINMVNTFVPDKVRYIYDVISSFVLKFYILSFISIPLISVNIKNIFRHIFSILTWSLPDFGHLKMTNFYLAFKLIILHRYVSFELWNSKKRNICCEEFLHTNCFFITATHKAFWNKLYSDLYE